MRILLYGITGFVGAHLAREAAQRGHVVTGVARQPAEDPMPDGVTAVVGSVFDAETAARWALDADAIVVAVDPLGSAGPVVGALPGLLAAAGSHARLGFVGGAGSLRSAPGGPLLMDVGFPDEWKPAARAHLDLLEALRASSTDVDWFVLTPPEIFGPVTPGSRTGAYRVGGDVAVVDERMRSRISGADFAVAFVDELETPRHRRTRFTVGY